MLEPRLDILPASQRRLWDELGQSVPQGFVLYGGTALALRLGHRASEDFDFFSTEAFLPGDLEDRVAFLARSQRLQSSPNTLVSQVDRGGPVKVSFFGGLGLRRACDPEPIAGTDLVVASLLDLAATKVKVVQDRAEAKDYLDISQLLLEGVGLDQALGAASAVFGPAFNPLPSLKALCYFEDGDLPSLSSEVKARLASAVNTVDAGRLPSFAPLPGGLAR
ncbi:MAG TPA: nucleotidyl transferase AbiEii/AbiGii toxin family protein [Thermoanaerobaculia bacterium]|nr:nucleotidyl transferase AbiEii/AbiGii toxin family protein [Thermoanaerobaculia bacterium]